MMLSATCAIGEVSRIPSHYRAEQYDSDLGLYYLRARYYNPATGRFLSRDPQNGKPYDPKTLHKYLYAGGDPINSLDPTGRAELFESAFIEGGSKQTATEGAIEAVGVRIAACIQQFADSFQSLISLLDTRSVDNGGKFVVNIFKLALCYYKFDKVPEEPPPPPPPPCEDPLECSPPWGPGAHGPGGVPDADLFAPREFKELQWEAMASVTA